MDPNSNGAHFLPSGVNPFIVPARFSANQPDYPHLITGPQSNIYQPPVIHRGADVHSSPSSSNQSFTSPVDYPPITPPHLTHSRRGSRESGETSSSNSTPSSGPPGSSLVHRHKRGHASASMSPVSPVALRKVRKPKKKDSVEEDEDDAMMSDEDPVVSQKVRREDAKKSRQDAEQKRRDQLKGAYDMLRGAVPGTSEKTSKVLLVNHARLYIEKLLTEREKLRNNLTDAQEDLKSLRALNERLMAKLVNHHIDFNDDLRATNMEVPPDDEPTPQHTGRGHEQSMTPTNSATPSGPPPPPTGSMGAPQMPHRPTHIRTSSNVSGSYNNQLQVPSNVGIPMSAPPHSTSLPSYPPLPMSTPSSPIKGSNGMMGAPHGPGAPMSRVPNLQISFPGPMHVLPSPSSSASSSAPRHSIYSPDGQNTMFYSDEHSSSDSHRSSAASSHVAVNVAHLTLEEQNFLRQQQQHQQQHGSTPHSPSQGMAGFGGPVYAGSAPYHNPEMQFSIQGYPDPGLGLQTANGHDHGNGMHDAGHGYMMMSHDDMNSIPAIPGAFPHDDALRYAPHHPHPSAAFLPPGSGSLRYQDHPHEMDYPTLTFTQEGVPTGPMPHVNGDMYVNTSPAVSRAPSPPHTLAHQQQQFASSPASQHTPQPGMGPQLLAVSTPTISQMGSSPRPVDQLHSPNPPHSPSGSYQDTQHGGGRAETGIAPSMLVGSQENGGHEPAGGASNGADGGNTSGPSDGTWFPA